jgi:hypothetical protein
VPPVHLATYERPWLTFWHWSSVTPYTSPYGFAGSCVFGKQSPGILSLRPLELTKGRPYSEVTADFLPSSLEYSHSFALLYSSCTPVSVCGTDVRVIKFRSFSWKTLHSDPYGRTRMCSAVLQAPGGFACQTMLQPRTPIQ